MLLRQRWIDDVVIRKLVGSRHSGFSLHNAVRLSANDAGNRRAVAEYVLHSSFFQDKLRYRPETGTIIYHSKMRPALKRNFEVFSACDWLGGAHRTDPEDG